MSTSSIPTTLPTVEKLIQRTRTAERSQKKEIRITIEEAKDLTAELALLTSKLGTTIGAIHNFLKQIKQEATEVDVKFDGGSF